MLNTHTHTHTHMHLPHLPPLPLPLSLSRMQTFSLSPHPPSLPLPAFSHTGLDYYIHMCGYVWQFYTHARMHARTHICLCSHILTERKEAHAGDICKANEWLFTFCVVPRAFLQFNTTHNLMLHQRFYPERCVLGLQHPTVFALCQQKWWLGLLWWSVWDVLQTWMVWLFPTLSVW